MTVLLGECLHFVSLVEPLDHYTKVEMAYIVSDHRRHDTQRHFGTFPFPVPYAISLAFDE